MQTGPSDTIDKTELMETCSQLMGLVLTRGTPHNAHGGKTYYLQTDNFGTNQISVERAGSSLTLYIKEKHLTISYRRDANQKSTGYLHAHVEIPHEGKIHILDKEGPWQDHMQQIHTKAKKLLENLPSYILTIETAEDAKIARAYELYQ